MRIQSSQAAETSGQSLLTIKNHSNRLELKRRVAIGKTIDISTMDSNSSASQFAGNFPALNPKKSYI